MKKDKVPDKIIRIVAKCDRFEFDEQIEEKKCLPRLNQIRELFLYKKTKTIAGRKRYGGCDKLSVTTSVVNPTFF